MKSGIKLCVLGGSIMIAVLCFSGCHSRGGSAKEIADGRRLYLSYGCGACHGMDGHGDGPAAASLKVAPRDFHHSRSFRGDRTVEAVSRTIAEGFRGGVMPASPFIGKDERRLIAIYVLSLADRSGS